MMEAGTPFVASYSGGKDCVLAIHRAVERGLTLDALLVTWDRARDRSWFHGLSPWAARAAAESMGAPVDMVETGGERYAQDLTAALVRRRMAGARACVFGDIDLEEHRRWCTLRCEEAGLVPLFPLWGEDRAALVAQGLALGYRPRITVVDRRRLPLDCLGRTLTTELAQQIARTGADVCGENGEYHTFVEDGPIFRRPVTPRFGTPVIWGDHMILPMEEGAGCHSAGSAI